MSVSEQSVPLAVDTGADVLRPLVSVIVPCLNAERWLRECLSSVASQTYRPLELSLFDDASTDASAGIIAECSEALRLAGVTVTIGRSSLAEPSSCGASKNRAVHQSSGSFLCFLDADDTMMPERVAAQLKLALSSDGMGERRLIGTGFARDPADAQPRHTAWLNGLTDDQLVLQRFCETTVAMVTWFCARALFDRLGGFSEAGRGTPEDLMFFYRHLRSGGLLARVHAPLVLYRAHEDQEHFRVSRESIWALRVEELELTLLPSLVAFSIWSAGRDGKRLYRSLAPESRRKVVAFLDVDANKLAAGHYYDREQGVHVPIVSWTCASQEKYQPTIICVKRGLHSGFEDNLASLELEEGRHFWYFN